MEKNQDSQATELCANKCGFYGNPLNNNLCSKCFKETQQKLQSQQKDASQIVEATAAASAAIQAQMPIAPAATQAEVPSTSAAAMDASSNVPAMDSAMDVDSPSWLEEPAHSNVESIIESALLNIAPELPSSSAPGSHAQSPLLVESSGMLTPRKRIQTNKGRCLQCRTRVPLVKQTVNKCRCGYVFCDSHRFHDQHNCDFDIVGRDRNVLEKRNPKLNELPKGGRSFNRID